MLRAFLFLLLFIPLTALFATSAIFCTLIDSSGTLYHRHALGWSRLALRLARVKVEVEGREKVPLDQPVIFMCNHQSNFDILALFVALPRKFAWIAKEELFRIPIFGYSMARAGYIPLDRGDGRRAIRSMEAAAAKIQGGKSVVIFPEGTRTADGKLLPFKQGGFMLAGKAGVPVVPVAISGSREINPAKQMMLRPGTIRIKLGGPITPGGTGSKQREALMDQTRAAINAALEWR